MLKAPYKYVHVCAYVFVCACVCSNSYSKSLNQLKTKFTWDHHGVGEKIYSNDSGVVVLYFNFVSPRGSGAFSGAFTTNLSRQCRAFSRALKIEKLKAPLFCGPEGAGATNELCLKVMLGHSVHTFWADINTNLLEYS